MCTETHSNIHVYLGNNIYWFKFAYLRLFFFGSRIGYRSLCACAYVCFADTGVECVPLSVMLPSETLPFLTVSILKLVFASTLCVFVHISKLFSKLTNQTIKIFILVGYVLLWRLVLMLMLMLMMMMLLLAFVISHLIRCKTRGIYARFHEHDPKIHMSVNWWIQSTKHRIKLLHYYDPISILVEINRWTMSIHR